MVCDRPTSQQSQKPSAATRAQRLAGHLPPDKKDQAKGEPSRADSSPDFQSVEDNKLRGPNGEEKEELSPRTEAKIKEIEMKEQQRRLEAAR